MPRRREVEKRNIDPDPKYNDRLVSKLINVVMSSGKKAVAEQIVYGAFEIIEQRNKEEPIKVFKRAKALTLN
jgi:small subunit ribosomal protein S7